MLAVAQAGRQLYRKPPDLNRALAAWHPPKVPPATVATPAGLARPRAVTVTVAKPPVARLIPPPLTVEQMAAVLRHSLPPAGYPFKPLHPADAAQFARIRDLIGHPGRSLPR